mgnify:CR=1 FL=1
MTHATTTLTSSDMDKTTARLGRFWIAQQDLLDEILLPLLSDCAGVVYLDYPVYSNIGDLLIYLGTEVWFQKNSLDVRGRWNCYNFHFPPLPKDYGLLLQGGGNFGDLYVHQAFREQVVAAYPENRVVFLPQTVFFRDPSALERAGERLNVHSDLHILLRDHESLETVKKAIPMARARLAPDMAINLYPLESTLGVLSPRSRRVKRLCLSRTDIEQPEVRRLDAKDCSWIGDWRDLLGLRRYWTLRMWNLAAHVIVQPRLAASFHSRWYSRTRTELRLVAAQFCEAEAISASRLHGHLLASLLGIPNEVLDNSYGKNSAYYNTWHQEFTTMAFADLDTYSGF